MKKLLCLCLTALLLAAPGLAEGERIALICGQVAGSAPLEQIVNKAESLKDVYGYELTVLECADAADWPKSYAATAEVPCELIIGVGREAAAAAAAMAAEPREGVAFAVIDADAGSGNVASYLYREEESAYVLGVLAAAALPDATRFGCLDSGNGGFPSRWGFCEGVRSVTPEAAFRFAAAEGDAETRAAALALREAGCAFVFSGAEQTDAGLFQAALELAGTGAPLYVAGQNVDAADPENPCVLSAQLKNTGVTALIIIDNFYAGTLVPGLTELDMASGAIGVAHVTGESADRNDAVLTDRVLETCRAAAASLADGTLKLTLPGDPDGWTWPTF